MGSKTPLWRRSLYKFLHIRSRKPRTLTTSGEELFLYSKPLDDAYIKPTNSFTVLPCRVPLQDHGVRVAVRRLYSDEDVIQIMKESRLESSDASTDSPIGRYSTLLFPDCLPERLEAVTFLIEAGFLYDGTSKDFSSNHDGKFTFHGRCYRGLFHCS